MPFLPGRGAKSWKWRKYALGSAAAAEGTPGKFAGVRKNERERRNEVFLLTPVLFPPAARAFPRVTFALPRRESGDGAVAS